MPFRSAIADIAESKNLDPARTGDKGNAATHLLADALHQAIQTAQTTGDLEQLHDELTDLWDRGQVDRNTAETLTRLMWERDRQFYQAEQRQSSMPPEPTRTGRIVLATPVGQAADYGAQTSPQISAA